MYLDIKDGFSYLEYHEKTSSEISSNLICILPRGLTGDKRRKCIV